MRKEIKIRASINISLLSIRQHPNYEVIADNLSSSIDDYAATQAVEFAKWINESKWENASEQMWYDTEEIEVNITTEQLYQIFKETGA